MRTTPIRVVIADDHPLVRDGIAAVFSQAGDINVVGVASDGREAVALTLSLCPDVVVMDISMPKLNGLDSTRQIVNGTSGAKVVCLSMHTEKHYVLDLLRAGASGYVLKSSPEDELVAAVRVAASGEIFLSAALDKVVKGELDSLSHPGKTEEMTAREREVLQLIAEGLDTKIIADHLGISPKTVFAHRESLMRKLRLDSTVLLARHAYREGIAQI